MIEGMAAGCCVIASKGGGPSEVISHEVNGLLVDRNDPLALAQNLQLAFPFGAEKPDAGVWSEGCA